MLVRLSGSSVTLLGYEQLLNVASCFLDESGLGFGVSVSPAIKWGSWAA